MSDVAEKLAEARKLIERGWTQGEYARGKSGRQVEPKGRAAVCFCAAGAIGAAYRTWPGSHLEAVQALSRVLGGTGGEVTILDWNDQEGRTQTEVIEAFKRAEQIARGDVA